ncbi:LysE family transporter [Nocardioides sp. CER19]|uniref:LysE family translocator n=1 Tax=Nocardioides sp. CER19 TaxID=3038538 RepID=UPI002447D6B0|nr:LysE family transporter [Nocardioides sp. CER19]MDH2414677.1 LysE family transporter [Nocardioides sp. CER19]
MTPTFLLTSLVIVLLPGSGTVYTVAAALARGTRAGVVAAAASTLGILPHLLAAITGLAALLHASGVAYQAVKYAGVAYLLYLAWSTWRDTGALRLDAAPHRTTTASVLLNGVAVNLLNPKLTIFFVAFLPQFVPAGDGSLPLMLALSAVFMLMTFVVFVAYAALAGRLRERVLGSERVMRRLRQAFAACFVGLGARLATER